MKSPNIAILLFCITHICAQQPWDGTTYYTQQPWDAKTYPDEKGFRDRISGVIEKIAGTESGEKSKALSKCPDTGLPVRLWALEGEEIISPYTGRRYIQGPTGYFGPKSRDSLGRIDAFGGDPLKKDLPPATATLLLDPGNELTRAFLTIPGNLKQQYHFAAKNWARFYPLLADKMGNEWKKDFHHYVANYEESRRPSDGAREHAYLSRPHNLIGEPGELLGGNMKDGGTENHKTMWRTSALLYSQIFPEGSYISGTPAKEAEKMVTEMLSDYLRRCLITGNGEYDSQIYYPHSIGAFLNLYDFSPDENSRLLAKFALDYYFATYGLKVIDGTIAGSQKRGFMAGATPGEMEKYLWMWTGKTSRKLQDKDKSTTIHQATTTYRPNKIICNIITKNIPLPFEAQIARPLYHMNEANAFQETFYCSDSYALGSVAMTLVDNPTQQMVWSLVAEGRDGPLGFGGSHPRYQKIGGHSPYSQVIQKKGTLILMTGQTKMDGGSSREKRSRQEHASEKLEKVSATEFNALNELRDFFSEAPKSEATWFYIPRKADSIVEYRNKIYVAANETFLCITPLNQNYFWMDPDEDILSAISQEKGPLRILNGYKIMVIPGKFSGFILETGEKKRYGDLFNFMDDIETKTEINWTLARDGVISYRSLQKDNLELEYNPSGLRAKGHINGEPINWENWANGGVYDSPYIKTKDGKMWVSDGEEAYEVDFTGDLPVYRGAEAIR